MTTPADYPMFVNRDGLYGDAEELLIFEYGQLTARQWRNIGQLDGFDLHNYITAVIHGDGEEVNRLEEDYELETF